MISSQLFEQASNCELQPAVAAPDAHDVQASLTGLFAGSPQLGVHAFEPPPAPPMFPQLAGKQTQATNAS